MYKSKLKFVSFIIFGIICVILAVFATLLYVETTNHVSIFNIAADQETLWKGVSVILFAATAVFFVIAVILFIFYLLAVSHNNAIILKVKKIKESFANAKNLSIETVDEELIKLKTEIDEAKKNGIELKNPYLTGEANNQTITITQTGPNGTTVSTAKINN